jgi:hypothetical protein
MRFSGRAALKPRLRVLPVDSRYDVRDVMRGLSLLQGEALLEFSLNFLPKSWCSLAWIEQVWAPDFCFVFKYFFPA